MGLPSCACVPPDGDDWSGEWPRECDHHRVQREALGAVKNALFKGGLLNFTRPKDVKIHKVTELNGVLLDKAVAKAMGFPCVQNVDQAIDADTHMRFFSVCMAVVNNKLCIFAPSSDWKDGGPIIEKERISIRALHDIYEAHLASRNDSCPGDGHSWPVAGGTALVAAMRAFVIHRLGEEVRL